MPQSYIQPDIPEILYHYTDQNGLLGILRNRELWATHIQYLNDSAEFLYGQNMVQRILGELKETDSINADYYDGLLEATDPSDAWNFFVVSLSEEKDLLSQWRGYTPIGKGYSIGFDATILYGIYQSLLDVTFTKCIYEVAIQEVLVKEVISHWLCHYKSHPHGNNPSYSFSRIKWELAKYCLFFKHPSFNAENEWRIMVSSPHSATKEIPQWTQFRPGKSMLIPYVIVNIINNENRGAGSKTEGEESNIPIREVIIGPTPHADLSRNSVQMCLDSCNINATIENSDIPYRDW